MVSTMEFNNDLVNSERTANFSIQLQEGRPSPHKLSSWKSSISSLLLDGKKVALFCPGESRGSIIGCFHDPHTQLPMIFIRSQPPGRNMIRYIHIVYTSLLILCLTIRMKRTAKNKIQQLQRKLKHKKRKVC